MRVFSSWLTLLLTLSTALAVHGQRIFVTKDISPDPSNYKVSNGDFPAGRIKALAVDPNDPSIVYAAGEYSGVWKSTTGVKWIPGPHGSQSNGHTTSGMTWFQASKGLRSGFTVSAASLAVDQSNSQRMLYATGDDDGRVGETLGGLWVSINAAESWFHVNLCSPGTNSIASVSFTAGQPYVSTACGIWTTTNSDLTDGTWQLLTQGNYAPPYGSLVADGGGTLYACSGNQVYQTSAAAANSSGDWNSPATIGGTCQSLAAPNQGSASTTAVALWTGPTNQEVSTITFGGPSPIVTNLKFSSRPGGASAGGQLTVAVAPIASSSTAPGPGVTFDVYASDSCAWYGYNAGPPAAWSVLATTVTTGYNCGSTFIHVDSWAMAFPNWYNPAKGLCAAYAATDGGVFFSGGYSSVPGAETCANSWLPNPNTWSMAQHGLHALYSDQIAVITAGAKPLSPSGITEAIYLPTQDNDTFATTFGWESWQSVNDGLGDSNQAFVDPAFPNQVLISRNLNYNVMNPPLATGSVGLIPQPLLPKSNIPYPTQPLWQFDWGVALMQTANLAQVMSTNVTTAASSADYITVLNQDFPNVFLGAPNCALASAQDRIWRNRGNLTTYPGPWIDISPATNNFLACNIGQIQVAGGHGSPVIYVLTAQNGTGVGPGGSVGNFPKAVSAGQIYKGQVSATGRIAQWQPASGSSKEPLGIASAFYVNPYNSQELYAVTNNGIMASVKGGATWKKSGVLTDIATNYGEYRIGCIGLRFSGPNATAPFTQGCSLSGMAFDAFKGKIRVAAMFFGGIAFSRDGGLHWMAVDVTGANHLPCWPTPGPPCFMVTDDLTQIVASVAFDGETHGTKPPKKKPPIPGPDQVIYAGLRGSSIRAIIGPFLQLTSLNFTYKPVGSPKQVSVIVLSKGLQQTVPLRACTNPSGNFCGSLLFDWKIAPVVKGSSVLEYRYVGDGTSVTRTYKLTKADEDSGVANVSD